MFWTGVAVVVVGGLIFFSERPGDADEQVASVADSLEFSAVPESDDASLRDAADPALAGTYESGLLPAASTPGRTFELTLNNDDTAVFTADYQNGQGSVVEAGSWEAADGVVTVTLDTRRGYPITEPLVYSFEAADDGSLSLIKYDRSRWGDMGLTLKPVAE